MVTGSVRHEGSSKFGKNHRWGTFWAVSGGWRISNEAFLHDVSFLDDLKVRVGYGVTEITISLQEHPQPCTPPIQCGLITVHGSLLMDRLVMSIMTCIGEKESRA